MSNPPKPPQAWDSFFKRDPAASDDFQRGERERLIETLRKYLPPEVLAAAVFGQVDSEVNLLLIADEGFSGLRAQALLAPVERELGCHIEVYQCTAAEWSKRLESGDGFVQEILSGRVVLLRGELQREADGDCVDANLARMQHPFFKVVARALEQFVPDDAGFGRFRDGK